MNAEVDDRSNEVAQKLSVGYQWLRSEQPVRAQESFEAALVLAPDNGRAHAWRAVALLKRATPQGGKGGHRRPLSKQWRTAIEDEIQEALRVGSEDAFTRYLCAHILRQTGNPRRAMELLELNAAHTPHDETTWLEIARCRMRMMQARQAETAARRAVEYAPLSASAHEVLAWILETRGKRRESQGEWQTALRINPESAEAHIALGQSYFRTFHLTQAEHHLSEGLRQRPHSSLVQSQLRETQILRRYTFFRVMTHLYTDLQASWKAKAVIVALIVLGQFRKESPFVVAWLFWGLVAFAGVVTLWRIVSLLRNSAPSSANLSS